MKTIADQWNQYATSHDYDIGEVVFNEGDPGDALYIVDSGQLAIIKNMDTDTPVTLGYRGEGSLLGEISLLSDAPRAASAIATQPTTLLAIPRDTFWTLMQQDTEFQKVIMQTVISALLAVDQKLVSAAASEKDMFSRLGSLSTENEQLAELMRLRQETIHFVVHDLRNPLNMIQMSLKMLKSTAIDDERRERFQAMASGGVTRMLSLVDVMLDVEKLEEGQSQLNLAEVDVARLVNTIVERTTPMAEACQIALAGAWDDGLPLINADRLRLDRVLTNLIDNAIKFVPPGGYVTVSARREGDEIRVAVNDTGPGIPADQRERVFERFAQTETGRKASGFGLGLAYCRTAILAHGGHIWVEEGEDGVGTKFVFSLPISAN